MRKILSIIIGYFFLQVLFSCNNSISDDEKLYAETQKGVINFLLDKEIAQLQYSGIFIPDTISFLDKEKETVKLSSINGKRNVYFCFDQTSSCSLCVQIAAEIILDASKVQNINFIIISKFHSTKDIKIFQNSHELNELDNVTILSGGFDDIGLKIVYPTFFVLDANNKTEMVYIHDKSYSETTKKYIELLMEKLTARC